ncbi:MAG: DUF393 domain-containing protein [Opitutaceae bacterium]|nr:DUF393 domain-containing protein [Opitutaceae bacterium]
MKPGSSPEQGAAEAAVAGAVLFFDGECGLCQRLVRLLLRLDRGARLRYAALQSPVAQAYLRRHGLPVADFDSLVFVPDWRRREQREFLVRTAGALAALRVTGNGPARFAAGVLGLVPERLRDAGYRCVARVRHRVFGAGQERPLDRPEWAERFLHG